MINPHLIIKFWSRKNPVLFLEEIKESDIICDPFCGSGSSGFSVILKNSSAFLSDINPVSIFISYNLLNKEKLNAEIIKEAENLCFEIEKEIYTIDSSKIVNFAVWKTNYKCPFCGSQITSIRSSKIRCSVCDRRSEVNALIVDEKVISLRFLTGEEISDEEKLIKRYLEIENCLSLEWHPKGEFIYPGTKIKFKDGPHKSIKIEDLFTKRNLYAASKIYSFVEKVWKEDKVQGDFLKMSFIASLASATKMLPHSRSSGPSWKVPRYWIPPLREERNFCRAFIRRVKLLADFKTRWLPISSNYNITVSFEGEIFHSSEKFIHIYRSNALAASQSIPKVHLVILDPPHYDEINYFEMTYLWQKWLEGSCQDKRFRDYSYWKSEICVNEKVGKDLNWYSYQLHNVIHSYMNCLKENGRMLIMLHNKDRSLLDATVKEITSDLKGNVKVEIEYKYPRIPSSTQGLHGHRKYLCLIKIKR
ncbi:MAG: DNA adenine methylase [Ignisphaera sp.]